MGYGDATHFGQAKGLRLHSGSFHEFARCDEDRRPAVDLKPSRVVHTARCARPSIGEGFDDEAALLHDLPPQFGGRRFGEGRFAIVSERHLR